MHLGQQTNPKIFISYSHDTPEYRRTVCDLADRLRADGVDCEIDQYINGAPAEGWIRWMERKIEWADFVLVVCTEIYLQRFKGDDRLGGRGVNFEGLLISQTLYDQFLENTKFLPLIPESGSIEHVPWILKGGTTYKIPSDYLQLYRVLTNQPEVVKRPVGPRIALSPITGHAENDQISAAEMQVGITEQPFSAGDPQSRQALIDLLAIQLRRPDLQTLITDFVTRINRDFKTSFSNQQTDYEDFATFLVNQTNDDQRRLQVLHLLDAIEEKAADEVSEELLAYLLHTWVRNDEINPERIIRLPFNYTQTLDLLTASHHNQALIPDYTDAEFSNGRHKSHIYDHSHYQPPSGQWDKERECREIAKELLRSLADPMADNDNAVTLLSSRLRAYDTQPQNRPIKGIRIHQGCLDKHPLANAEIAEYFLNKIGRYLPVFVYGDMAAGDEKDYLYVSEEDMRGMLVERVAPHRTGPETKPSMPQETKMSNPNTPPITVNVVNNSPGTAIGNNINQVIDSNTKQALSDELARLKNAADEDETIGRRPYAEIITATETLKTEIAKPQVEKSTLAAAAKTLEGFKNVASIAGSIEKLSQLLLPLIS